MIKRWMTNIGMALGLCLAVMFPWSAMAQTTEEASAREAGEVSRITTEISNEIYSPFCKGKTLTMCPSYKAAEVRRDIQEMARQGKTKPEIKQQVLDTYGEEFRIVEPPAQDNAMLLVAILIGLVLAVAAVFVLSRKRKQQSADAKVMDPTEDPARPEEVVEDDLSDEDRAYLDELRRDL